MKVCACILLLLSVGSLRAQKPAQTPAASSRDTSLIRVNGPTIIAFFPTSQAQLDSNPDEGEALADFQFYLGEIRTDFARADIQLVETYADTVRLAVLGRVVSFATRDSTPVGYYFVRPGRAPFIAYGVQSGLDLCAEAERYFRLRPRSLCR